jgi:hypothetical protein
MGKRASAVLVCIFMIISIRGCGLVKEENSKVRDLVFTVLDEDKVPEALKTIIDERKADPFKFTYSDKEYLYICIGYGEQLTGGYSIEVYDLYLGDHCIYVSTSLLDPDEISISNSTPSFPYIVIKTEYLEETVIFQ